MRSSGSARSIGIVALVSTVFIASCGGGGGGGGGSSSSTQILLTDGQTLPGDFTIGTIEEANMAADRSIALIASTPTLPADRGVFLRHPNGDIDPVLSPITQVPPGVSLPTLCDVTMASTGEFIFQAGSVCSPGNHMLDDDTLFLFANGQLSVLAQAGSTPSGFRILGTRQIGGGGFLGFTGGTSPCTVDSSTGSVRDRCTLEIFAGTDTGISQVQVPNDLSNQDTGAVDVIVSDSQIMALNLPGRSNDPAIVEVRNGQTFPLLTQRQVVPGVGTLSSIQTRAVALDGSVVFDAKVDTNGDGQPDEGRVFLLSSGTYTSVAQTGVPAGSKTILSVRGVAIDDAGRVTFTAQFGDPGQSTGPTSLRRWDSGATEELAFVGQGFGQDSQGNDQQITDIGQIRVSRNGDVVFRVTLGTTSNGTTKTSGTQVVRFADGQLQTLLSTGTNLNSDTTIVSLTVADVNDSGDVLVIGSLNRTATRSLLLVPRQ